MGGNAVGQFQEGSQPLFLPLTKQSYVNPIVGPADDGTNGYGDDVQQLVPLTPLNPGVLNLSKVFHYGCPLPFLHHSPFFVNHPAFLHRDYTPYNAIALDALGFDAPSEFMRTYLVSQQWLALLLRRMDAVPSVYRLAATLSPGVEGLCSRLDFQRRGRFDAVTTLHNGRSFGIVRQGLALSRCSLYDRLRAIAEYDHTRRPSVVLVLAPSPWEQRLTDEFCLNVAP